MNKLEHYTPNDIPKEIQAYEAKVKQLGVGKSGKVGILRCALEGDQQATKERLPTTPIIGRAACNST